MAFLVTPNQIAPVARTKLPSASQPRFVHSAFRLRVLARCNKSEDDKMSEVGGGIMFEVRCSDYAA